MDHIDHFIFFAVVPQFSNISKLSFRYIKTCNSVNSSPGSYSYNTPTEQMVTGLDFITKQGHIIILPFTQVVSSEQFMMSYKPQEKIYDFLV
jgi:hypothetical protein